MTISPVLYSCARMSVRQRASVRIVGSMLPDSAMDSLKPNIFILERSPCPLIRVNAQEKRTGKRRRKGIPLAAFLNEWERFSAGIGTGWWMSFMLSGPFPFLRKKKKP